MRINHLVLYIAMIVCFSMAHIARADDTSDLIQTALAREQTLTPHFTAYARVSPISILRVRAGAAGTVTVLEAVPGDRVHAGEPLATLGGAVMQAEMAQAAAAVKTADARANTAKQLLAIAQKTLSDRLGTRQTLARAKSDLAAAEAARTAAEENLQKLKDMSEIKAPVNGVILARGMANGERVSAGETILTLRPDDSLWLTAEFYGTDAEMIHAGMQGVFTPADGGKSQPIVVRNVFAAISPDGGTTTGMMLAAKNTEFQDGAYGSVTLDGTKQKMIAVPTRALILDRGQWWVLVKTDDKGLQKRKVTIGPARGWRTFIKNGLDAGASIVTDNAYALFHRGIASRYQPPD
ncbi:MAG: efflux RND transporter periplasmic adaptor subunit [Alphaproteobacteria bacterium]|nr:efflux RND transporter periplasmic adaptor subunit [Alphaproteobacteria bacterium]MDE2337443.1 efflux RND transporter periplasmic adaptor subunit [Alphaproteobacteria bacterium]